MPQVTLRMIRSRALIPNFDATMREIERTFDDEIKPDLLEYFRRIVRSWEHRPDISSARYRGRGYIGVHVYPSGAHKQIWVWLSGGTRPYVIYPRRQWRYIIRGGKRTRVPAFLAYRANYQPRTQPGGKFGGPGRATGAWRFARWVQHPGIRARNFELHIARWYAPIFRRKLARAFRRGLLQAKRQARA